MNSDIDADLSMRTPVQRTVSWYFAVLRQVRQIRQQIPLATFQTLHGGGFSSVATGLWQRRNGKPTYLYLVRRLQSVLNASTWLISYVAPTTTLTRLPVYTGCASRSTSSLRSLCWRVKFFIGLHHVTWVRSSVSDLPGRRRLRSASSDSWNSFVSPILS